MLKPGEIAVVGAAETTKIGAVPELSQIGLHSDAALNAMADAGLKPTDIDGLACVGPMMPQQIAHYLGITPKWVDGTGVGGSDPPAWPAAASASLTTNPPPTE